MKTVLRTVLSLVAATTVALVPHGPPATGGTTVDAAFHPPAGQVAGVVGWYLDPSRRGLST